MSEAMHLAIEPNTRITLNFSLALETGEEVDSNFGQDPVSFVMGDGSLLPGFERRLLGMRAGDEAEFRIPSEEGFGDPQDDNIQEIPRREFDEGAPLEPGMLFSFADAAGGEVPGMIAAVGEDSVTVDFNHPLSGRTIHFRVRIARVEPAELHYWTLYWPTPGAFVRAWTAPLISSTARWKCLADLSMSDMRSSTTDMLSRISGLAVRCL